MLSEISKQINIPESEIKKEFLKQKPNPKSGLLVQSNYQLLL